MSTPTSSTIAIPDESPRLWVITFGTIGVWAAHVGAEISLAGYGRTHDGAKWVMHGLTVVLAAVAALMTLAAWRIVGRHRQQEGENSPDGRIAFLGWMGVYIGAIDVILIIVEGIYLATLHG